MKIWHGCGSDHSANLVMIGSFKTAQDAERVSELIDKISQQAYSDEEEGINNHWGKSERLSEGTEKLLIELSQYSFSPSDFADFALLNPQLERSDKELRFRSDDVNIGGFIKLMVGQGAKVQVYSGHDYPDSDEE